MHLRHPVEDTSTLYLIEFRYYFILLTFLCVYVSLLMHAHTYTQMRQTRTILHNPQVRQDVLCVIVFCVIVFCVIATITQPTSRNCTSNVRYVMHAHTYHTPVRSTRAAIPGGMCVMANIHL